MAATRSTGLSQKGLMAQFFARLEQAPQHFTKWSLNVPSTSDIETYRWLQNVPQMREWGDGRKAKGLLSESYSIQNLKYEATIEVDRDEIADDQTGQINLRIGELAARAGSHKDYLTAGLLAYGATTGYNSYDGVTYFSASHTTQSSGTQSNVTTSNITTATNPTSTEFRAAVAAAIQRLMEFKDDQGEMLHLTDTGITVVIPPNMRFAAREASLAQIIGQTSNVDVGLFDVVVLPQLLQFDDGSSTLPYTTEIFYILKTDGVRKPFVFQDREPLEFTALDTPDTDEGFRREKYLYGVRARYRLMYMDPLYAIQHTFT